jgi:hypothetical protein
MTGKSPNWLNEWFNENVYFNPILFIILRCCFQTIGDHYFLPTNQLFPYTPKQQMKIQNALRSEDLRGSVSEVMHSIEFQGSE